MTAPVPGVPEGSYTVCPYLIVPDAHRILDFMMEASWRPGVSSTALRRAA